MTTIKILLVDDHPLVRDALEERLQAESPFTVVGSVSSADEAIDAALSSHPDVILMDIDMAGMSCFDASRRITAALPDTRIIFLSAYMSDEYIEEALGVGAYGYVLKSEPTDTIIAAISNAAANKAYFSAAVRSRIVVDADKPRLTAKRHVRVTMLTPREKEILQYVARGLSTKEIATHMHLSSRTIDNHRTNLMNKLDIHDRVELTRFAIREGIVRA